MCCLEMLARNLDQAKIWWISEDLTLSRTSPGFYVFAIQVFLKTLWGKGEIACNEQFLLFPQCFLQVLKTFCHFH